jgi:hypothetical protein
LIIPGKNPKPKGNLNRAAFNVATREKKQRFGFESNDFSKKFPVI